MTQFKRFSKKKKIKPEHIMLNSLLIMPGVSTQTRRVEVLPAVGQACRDLSGQASRTVGRTSGARNMASNTQTFAVVKFLRDEQVCAIGATTDFFLLVQTT